MKQTNLYPFGFVLCFVLAVIVIGASAAAATNIISARYAEQCNTYRTVTLDGTVYKCKVIYVNNREKSK